MTEPDFLDLLRGLPLHPGALDLTDDAARLGDFIVTTDTLVEGTHFLATDSPGDVAWKLLAVNMSDLAAKGATPAAVLLNYPLSSDTWDRAFIAGFGDALRAFGCSLLGGDTVSGGARVFTVTAFGRAPAQPSVRSGAKAGDALWVTGTIGDAGAGLAIARGADGPPELLAAYRRPQPLLVEGRALGPFVHAMMDVSDGLLLDASRMASASGLAVEIDLDRVPLSAALRIFAGEDRGARLAAATAGDDYALLFAAAADFLPPVAATRVGRLREGSGLTLFDADGAVPSPSTLGFLHGR